MKPPHHNPDLTKDTVMQLHLFPMNVSQQIKRLRTDEIITSQEANQWLSRIVS